MFNTRNLSISQPLGSRFLESYASWAQVGVVFSSVSLGRPEMVKFVKLLKNNKGATAIEYGLIAALIAVAAIGAMQGIGNKLNTTFNNVSNSLN